MNPFAPIRSWWRALFHRSQTDRDIENELQFHIDTRTQYLVELGLSPNDAARQAKIELGRVDVQKEKYRTAIGLRPLHEIGADIRYGIRSLYRNPSVSLAAILSLALGIGATSAMFNVIYSALLNPFPYADADRIVNPSLIDEKQPLLPTWFALEPAQYESFIKAKSIESVLGFMLGALPETGGEFPEDVRTAFVTPNMNDFLGVHALMGRGLQMSDGSQNVIVLSYQYWQRRFGGDKTVIGRTLELNHESLTIIGVMPLRFTFTETVGNVDAYVPWSATRRPALFPWIKLRRGVAIAAANEEFQAYVKQFKLQTPMHFPDHFQVHVQPIAEPYINRTGRTLALLFASVVFLLLIGCANCSVLLLARGETRQHELSIRSAIGAGRFRLIRQLLIESCVIAMTGAALGVALSYWLAKVPLKLMPNMFPQEAVITINWPVLGFSIVLALITGILFGLAPAFRFSRPDVSQMMAAQGRTLSGTGGKSLNVLIAGQIALTFVLLGVAGAAVAGFMHITSMKLGYDPHNVGFISIPLNPDPGRNQRKYASDVDQLREAVASVPGISSVGVLSSSIPPSQPFNGAGRPYTFELLGLESKIPQHTLIHLVSPEYFATLRIPLLKGRIWTQEENLNGDFVAVANETFARRYLSGRDAIGQQVRSDGLKYDGRKTITSPHSGDWRQILGVVGDARNDGLERPVFPMIYVPYSTFMWNSTQMFFRTQADPKSMEHQLRIAFHAFNPEQRIFGNEIGTLDGALEVQPLWVQQHMFSVLFSFFGALALALSLFGIASTVLFAAGRRRIELGIRMALGAQRSHIVWMVSRTTLWTIGCGIIAGVVLNLALHKVLQHWMPGNNHSPWIFAPATSLLLAGSAIACLLPAMRAAHANPVETLRTE
jgi:predicted permease